jgi:acyl carrier protein
MLITDELGLALRTEFGDDQPLIGSGPVDSLALVQLVDSIEQHYGFAVADEELTVDNFGSLTALAGFVDRRLAAAGTA